MLPLFDSVPYKIINDDCLNAMKQMADNSIDFIVTDPPYGLNFMGKHWDRKVPNHEIWAEALRICKPGSMLAAFGGSRTHHHLMIALEQAGWEIRDVIMWLYGSGFPKSHNKFGLDGYGTALKPSHEPIILAMKPLDGTFAQNAEKWGLAGINIDASRIATNEKITRECLGLASSLHEGYKRPYHELAEKKIYGSSIGRWPANLILDEEAAEMLDEQTGNSVSKSGGNRGDKSGWKGLKNVERGGHNDSGGASRFFYCAKASPSERNRGCEEGNIHPTIKPLSLMRYIIKLLAPPGNPILLDPFAGSGSTLIAAQELGIESIGIEINPEYCIIAKKRLSHE